MKHTKLLVVALLVALLACLAVNAMADETVCPTGVNGLHNWAVKEEGAIPATCTTQGVRLYVCQNTGCGASKVEYTNPLGHAWGEYKQIKDATCAQPGVQQQVCTRCGHYSTENIRYTPAATGAHNFVVIAEGTAATCTVDGLKPIAKCSVCGAIDPNRDGSVAKATGHNITGKDWEVKREATCYQTGIIVKKCWTCGSEVETQETPKNNNHNWNVIVAAKPATCTTDGCKELQQCTLCGATRPGYDGAKIPAFGHNIVGKEWEVKREAHCYQTGIIVKKCKTCGAEIESQETPKIGDHVWNLVVVGKDPTCTTTGCKPLQQCLNCGATHPTDNGSQIPALGHKFSSWTTEPATCTKDGKSYSICERCGHVSVVVIPATGHSATWTPKEVGSGYVVWALHCGLCDMDLATQVVNNGEKAPSGTVNTGKANVDINYTGISKTEVVETAKKETKKTTTAKKTTNNTTAKKATNTATATAPKTEAAATEIPSAELKFGVAEYKVGDVTIKLNPDYTYTAELAEGETVALFVDADALAKPAEGNFVALSAEEATELPEGFVPTLVAIVKEADLPVATASK